MTNPPPNTLLRVEFLRDINTFNCCFTKFFTKFTKFFEETEEGISSDQRWFVFFLNLFVIVCK